MVTDNGDFVPGGKTLRAKGSDQRAVYGAGRRLSLSLLGPIQAVGDERQQVVTRFGLVELGGAGVGGRIAGLEQRAAVLVGGGAQVVGADTTGLVDDLHLVGPDEGPEQRQGGDGTDG